MDLPLPRDAASTCGAAGGTGQAVPPVGHHCFEAGGAGNEELSSNKSSPPLEWGNGEKGDNFLHLPSQLVGGDGFLERGCAACEHLEAPPASLGAVQFFLLDAAKNTNALGGEVGLEGAGAGCVKGTQSTPPAPGFGPANGRSAGGGSSSPSGFLLINTNGSHPCYFCGDSLFSLHPSPHCISWLHKEYHTSP